MNSKKTAIIVANLVLFYITYMMGMGLAMIGLLFLNWAMFVKIPLKYTCYDRNRKPILLPDGTIKKYVIGSSYIFIIGMVFILISIILFRTGEFRTGEYKVVRTYNNTEQKCDITNGQISVNTYKHTVYAKRMNGYYGNWLFVKDSSHTTKNILSTSYINDSVCMVSKIHKDRQDSIKDSIRKARKAEIDSAWVLHKWIKLVDTYNWETGKYSYFKIEKNSITNKYRALHKPSSVNDYEITYLANNVVARWKHPVYHDSIFIKTGDGKRKYVGIDVKNTSNHINDVCREKTSVLGKLVYSEYEACIRTASIIKHKFSLNEYCGLSNVSVSRSRGALSSIPNGCKSSGNWAYDSKLLTEKPVGGWKIGTERINNAGVLVIYTKDGWRAKSDPLGLGI